MYWRTNALKFFVMIGGFSWWTLLRYVLQKTSLPFMEYLVSHQSMKYKVLYFCISAGLAALVSFILRSAFYTWPDRP